jgi:hypothetical protein
MRVWILNVKRICPTAPRTHLLRTAVQNRLIHPSLLFSVRTAPPFSRPTIDMGSRRDSCVQTKSRHISGGWTDERAVWRRRALL